MGQEPGQIREEIEQTRDRMGETVDALSDKANVGKRVKQSAADKRDQVKESVSDKRDRLMEQMQTTTSQVNEVTPDADDVRHGAKRAVGVAEENPLGLAIGGLAAGFLLGMALPSTKLEDERIGPAADRIKDQARETGQEALERGRSVAQDAAESVREETQSAVSSVKETVQDSAQQEAEEMRTTV